MLADWNFVTMNRNVSKMKVSPGHAALLQVLICASVLAQNATAVKQASLGLVGAVFTLHAGGFLLGYLLARAFGAKERQARTMSIEVGM